MTVIAVRRLALPQRDRAFVGDALIDRRMTCD